MTRRAAPTTIEATTEQGTGLILPIVKALTHIMAVHNAITHEWPMTTEDALAEIDDASRHMTTLMIPSELMTAESADEIERWISLLQASLIELRGDVVADQNISDSHHTEVIKLLAKQTWQLITVLERELTGLRPADTDPGRLP